MVKRFYLAATLHPIDPFSEPGFVYDGEKQHQKNYLMGVFFQQLGKKPLCCPWRCSRFCGIMLGIGSSLSSHDVITLLPWLNVPLLQAIFLSG